MQVRILHINNEDPWVSSEILTDYFGVSNPAVKVVERLIIENALSIIENVGWVVSKVDDEKENIISLLFIKPDENE